MSELAVVGAGGGEVIAHAPDRRIEVLCEHEALHATWVRFGPRREGADLHVHGRHTDLFHVLAGELTLRLGSAGDEVPLPAGMLVRIPPLVVHGYRNGGDGEAVFLNCHAPGTGFAAYLRALRDGRGHAFDQEPPPADGGRPPPEAYVGGDATVVDRPGVRIRLRADADAIAVAEVAIEPGVPSPQAHVHRRHAESAYVLEGELAAMAGDRALRAAAGTWLTVPAGIPHAFAPSGSRRVRFLSIHAPGCGFGGFLRAMRDAGAGADLELAAAGAGHDRERAA